MSRHIRRPRSAAFLFLLLLASASPLANGGKVLTLDDYGRWSRVVSTAISPDGAWVSYGYRPNGGDDTLFVKRVEDGKLYTLANGSEPKFSDDSMWAAYVVSLPKKEADKLRKAKKPVTKAVEFLNLVSGEKFKVENASSFTFPAGAKVVAIKRDKADREAKHDGVDLIVRTLATGETQNIGNVSDYAFDKSGGRLAFTIDAPDELGNGVGVLDLARATMRSLDATAARYAQPAWNESGDRLAVLRGTTPKGKRQRQNALLWFHPAEPGTSRPTELAGAPGDMVISEFGDVAWSKDSSRVFIGLKEQQAEPEKSDDPVANVDVWHWKDERVQSIQAVRASADSRATYRAAVDAASAKLTVLADEAMPSVTLTDDGKWAIGRMDKPYRLDVSWGGSPADYYRIDTATGERTLIAKKIGRTVGASPDSKWFLFQRDGELWAYDIGAGSTVNISKASGTTFIDTDDDHPYEKPTYGVAGFSKDGTSVIVNHKFDLWRLPLDGGQAKNLTGGAGAKDQIVLRYQDLDPDERAIDLSQPILLSAYGEWTKQAGYFRLQPDGRLEKLVLEDRFTAGRSRRSTPTGCSTRARPSSSSPTISSAGPTTGHRSA